jgi:hypothetical protein
MLNALESAGNELDLPTRFLADLLSRRPTAGTGLVSFGQLMHLPSHGQLIEGRQVPPATTNAPHRATFGQRFI